MALGTDFALCACFQATLREIGMPRLVIRLITLQAILASTFCTDRVRAAPADQNLVPMESRFHECPLAIASGGLPAHPALLCKQLDVPVALSGLGVCRVAGHRG
jgi:hypothetical protein